MGEEIKRGRGRPKSDNPRRRQVKFNMTDEEYERLMNICDTKHLSKSRAIIVLINIEDHRIKTEQSKFNFDDDDEYFYDENA